jgi:hypothetical protein
MRRILYPYPERFNAACPDLPGRARTCPLRPLCGTRRFNATNAPRNRTAARSGTEEAT